MTRMSMTPLAMAMAVLLAGCSMMPTYQRPDAPVPATFVGDNGSAEAISVADIGWREVFTDPKLQQVEHLDAASWDVLPDAICTETDTLLADTAYE